MGSTHRIREDDLATLESLLPKLTRALYPVMDNRLRTMIRQVQKIVVDVRWDYGPPDQVETSPSRPPPTGSDSSS